MAELFENFEVNKMPRWRKLLRLTGLSFALHALSFLAIIYVPILREAFHVADQLSDIEYVDEDYQKTQIKDRAVMLDVSHFSYPPGYFNPQATIPAAEIIVQPTPMPLPKPIATPKPQPSPSPQTQPTPETADATPETKEDAEKRLDEIEAKTGVVRPNEDKINKKPLKDWLASWNEKYQSGKLDLNKTIELVIVAQRDEKGKLHDPQVVSKSGDPVLIEAGKELVAAVNDSNVLYFLEGVGGGTVRFIVKLDAVQVTASVESEVESEARAEKMAATYGLMLFLGEKAKSGKDEAVIYQNTQISARGKQVVVNFSMPRQAAGDMLKKQLPAS
jgi:hypothetical protein